VSTFPPIVGGVQAATADLCRELLGSGADVLVITRAVKGEKRRDSVAGVPVYRAGWPEAGKLGSLSYALHSVYLLISAARRYRVIHVQNIDVPLLTGLALRALGGRKLIATIHGEAKLAWKMETRLGRLRLGLMRKFVDRHVAITSAMKSELIGLGVEEEKIRQIPNGIDLERFRPPTLAERREARERLLPQGVESLVVCVGRLIDAKGIDLLLEAWRGVQRDDRGLVVIGAGPLREDLESLSQRLRLKNVVFVGLSRTVRDYLWAADAFVQASRREGLPIALLEAMAAGLPSVASDIPGHEEVLSAGGGGLLFEAGRSDALAHALREVLEDLALKANLGAKAREVVSGQYGLAAVAVAHQRMYSEVSRS